MELVLNSERFDYLRTTYKNHITQEETAEAIVPDTQPDILKIIDVCAQILMKSKEAEPGRVNIKGMVQTVILYLAEDGGLYKIDSQIPYNVSSAAAEISEDSMIIAEVKATGVDAAAANPRKIVVKVNLKSEIRCYDGTSAEICTGIDDKRVYQQKITVPVNTMAECGEKTFVVADELQIPDSMPPADEILSCECMMKCTDFSFSGRKLIIRGTLVSEICWIPVDGSRPRKKIFISDFSQMMDTEFGDDGVGAEIRIMITGCFADFNTYSQNDNGRELVVEVHAVAQYAVFPMREITYLRDIYSNDGALEIENEVITGTEQVSTERQICHIKDELRCSEPGNELFSVRIRFGDIVYSEGACKLNIYVTIGYFETEGELAVARGTIPAVCECEPIRGTISAEAENITVSFGRETVTVAADVVLIYDVHKEKTICNVTMVSLEPAEQADTPSIIVHRVREGDTMWNLAKKYRSSSEGIAIVNELEDDTLPTTGRIILIPKA